MIFADDTIKIEQPAQGVTRGHLIISPQEEAQSIEELDPSVMAALGVAASKAATVLFETLGAQGTNIILNEDPIRYEVIARAEDDGWSHQWTPQQLDENTMKEAAQKIADAIPLEEPPKKAQKRKPEEPAQDSQDDPREKSLEELEAEEDYKIKQLTNRIP